MHSANHHGQQIDQTLSQFSAHHERTCHHEEWNGNQRKTLGLRDHLLNGQINWHPSSNPKTTHRGQNQSVCNGNGQQRNQNKQSNDQRRHAPTPVKLSSSESLSLSFSPLKMPGI